MMYYEKEWDLICYMFDTLCEDIDTPLYVIETAFSFVHDEYKKHPDIPPSILMIDAMNKASYCSENSRTEFSETLFESSKDVIDYVLRIYLQEILLIDEDDRCDYMAERASIWRAYFTEDEYEQIKYLYS